MTNKTEVKHTPTPWRIYRDSMPAVVSGSDADDTFRYVAQDMTEADAEFIVRAANAHVSLLDVCEALHNIRHELLDSPQVALVLAALDAALAKARGK